MYGVFFRSGEFTFVDPGEFTTSAVRSWKACFDATADLAAAASGVALDGAPLASWVLARLAGLSESTFFPKDAVRREGELGGFHLRVLAVRGTERIARLRLDAECGGTELTATAADEDSAAVAAHGLIAALMANPERIERFQVSAKAMELGGHRNEYGYDGVSLLGQFNIYK
jgi:hypothetical protein